MPSLDPYLSPDSRDERLAALVSAAGGNLVEYGRSVLGRPLLAGRLPGGGMGGAGQRVLVTANIHGPEVVSCAVALALLGAVADMPALVRLRARAELWVIPCLNPDGYARTWEQGGQGRLAKLRSNANGVDLNRNFPLPAGQKRARLPGAGSTRPGDATYVGRAPLSEPETRSLALLLEQHPMRASANLHSFMGRLIPAHVTDAVAFARYKRLCGVFKSAQPHSRYGRLSSRRFDTFTGELEDYQHHHLGIWAMCVEVFPWWASLRQHLRAPSLFWRFNPRDPAPWAENDVGGIAAFLHAALDLEPTARPAP